MKKRAKKGFTLIEVVGVLIILSVIFVLAFPSIISHFRNAENAIDEATKNLIVDATKDYMNNNSEDYRINDKITYCIKIEDLVSNNLLTEKQLANMENIDQYVKVSYDESTALYEISEECTPNLDSTFVLNGEQIVTLKLNEFYEELGVRATDENNNDISGEAVMTIFDNNGIEVQAIDTSKIGTYVIRYTLTIYNIYSKQIEREVRIIDDIAPVIVVDLFEDNLDDTVLTYDLLSKISVSDNSGELIKPVVRTDLSLGVAGIYKVNVTATDSSGNTSTIERQIQIYTRALAYPAVVSCSDGRTLDASGNCTYEYTDNATQCGCKTNATCENSACGIATYKSCATSACGVASYNSCATSACGTCSRCVDMQYFWGYTCTTGCVCTSTDSSSCCYGDCPGSEGGGYVHNHWASCAASESYDCTCAHSACGIASYKSCPNSACGVESYNSCENSACGCSVGNDCTKTENEYKIYTCPEGGTLNETICEM